MSLRAETRQLTQAPWKAVAVRWEIPRPSQCPPDLSPELS